MSQFKEAHKLAAAMTAEAIASTGWYKGGYDCSKPDEDVLALQAEVCTAQNKCLSSLLQWNEDECRWLGLACVSCSRFGHAEDIMQGDDGGGGGGSGGDDPFGGIEPGPMGGWPNDPGTGGLA